MAGTVVFKGSAARVMEAVMGAVIPRGGAFPLGAEDFDLIPRAEEILQSYDPLLRRAFPLLLKYLQLSALMRTGRPFTRLTQEKAVRFLVGMEHSPFYYRRTIVLLFKLITCLTFYDVDEAAEQIGYRHSCGPGSGKGVMRRKAAKRG